MKINYRLTEEDYLNFNLFHLKNSKTGMRTLYIQRFITPVFFLILSYIFSIALDDSFIGLFIMFLIISILWIIFYPKYFYSFITRHTKKMIKERKNDGLLGDHRMIMAEEGIVDATSKGETKVTWSGIKHFTEDKDYFFLYNSSVSAYILPKREINDVEETKNYIQSKLTIPQ